MAEAQDNVLVLTSLKVDKRAAEYQGSARIAIGQLDELGWRLRELSPGSNWSAEQWMIASTSFRVQLIGTRKKLDDLAETGTFDKDAFGWIFEFNDARSEAERRLHDIRLSLQCLHLPGISPEERMRETEIFTITKPELLRALKNVEYVITKRLLSERQGA